MRRCPPARRHRAHRARSAKKELDAYRECGLLCRGFARLFGALTRIFVGSVERFYSEREKRHGVLGAAKTGAVSRSRW